METSAAFIGKHKFLSVLVLFVVLGVMLGLFMGTTSTLGSGTEKKVIKGQGWNYTLTLQDGALEQATIDYDVNSRSGIEVYANAMRQENEQLYKGGITEVAATSIVLNHPLTWDEADALVKKFGIYARGYEFRATNTLDSNDRATFSVGVARNGGTGQGFDGTGKQLIDGMVQRINNPKTRQMVVKGVIGIQAGLTYSQYQQISADPSVYLAEMPRQIIKSKLQRKAIPEMAGIDLKNVNFGDVNLADVSVNYAAGPLYRHLEDQKMVKTN